MKPAVRSSFRGIPGFISPGGSFTCSRIRWHPPLRGTGLFSPSPCPWPLPFHFLRYYQRPRQKVTFLFDAAYEFSPLSGIACRHPLPLCPGLAAGADSSVRARSGNQRTPSAKDGRGVAVVRDLKAERTVALLSEAAILPLRERSDSFISPQFPAFAVVAWRSAPVGFHAGGPCGAPGLPQPLMRAGRLDARIAHSHSGAIGVEEMKKSFMLADLAARSRCSRPLIPAGPEETARDGESVGISINIDKFTGFFDKLLKRISHATYYKTNTYFQILARRTQI